MCYIDEWTPIPIDMPSTQENLQKEESNRPSQGDANSYFGGNIKFRICAFDKYATVEEDNTEFDTAISYNCKGEDRE